jgi:hypothetical protein
MDELYRRPLNEFVASRNELAAALEGADRKRVKALEKPSALAWAVNQTYWHARAAYDRVLKAGSALRAGQLSSLRGRSADVRSLIEHHREAVGQAVAAALKLADAAGVHPPADALRTMFETMSTRESVPESHGRFVKTLQASGFEALAGISVAASSQSPAARTGKSDGARHLTLASSRDARAAAKRREAEEKEARERARAERRYQAAVDRAEHAADRTRTAERDARVALDHATRAREAAEERLAELREGGPDRFRP